EPRVICASGLVRYRLGSLYVLVRPVPVFFFQAEDGIRDRNVTGVQTCALPILFRFGHCTRNTGFASVFSHFLFLHRAVPVEQGILRFSLQHLLYEVPRGSSARLCFLWSAPLS